MSELETKKAVGTWDLAIYGECPHCNEVVNFADADYFFTEFGFEPVGKVTSYSCHCPECNGYLSLDVDEGL